MTMLNYFDSVKEGIQFIIAVGSIVGLLGLVIGIMVFIFGSSRVRLRMLGLIIFSIILLSICGLRTGQRFFHIH